MKENLPVYQLTDEANFTSENGENITLSQGFYFSYDFNDNSLTFGDSPNPMQDVNYFVIDNVSIADKNNFLNNSNNIIVKQ